MLRGLPPGAVVGTSSLRREALPVQKLLGGDIFKEVLSSMNYSDPDALYAAIAENHVSPKTVVAS